MSSGNAVAQIAEQLRHENNISLEQAMPIATVLFKGQSVWELMQARMSRIDLLYCAAAAFIAFRIPRYPKVTRLLLLTKFLNDSPPRCAPLHSAQVFGQFCGVLAHKRSASSNSFLNPVGVKSV